jgi:hypothetical protein
MSVVPKHYIPDSLDNKDKQLQKRELIKSQKLYKKSKYHTRKKLKSFKNKKSKWLSNVKKIYKFSDDEPINIDMLVKKTKCTKKSLNKIIKKGMGAYYSSGSRPNQTPQSWGISRLYSAISGGPASNVDLNILQKGCPSNGKVIRLARKSKENTSRKKNKIGGYKMKERIIQFEKSPISKKKYRATLYSLKTGKKRTLDFGASDYQQYKDRTKLGVYTQQNHNSRKRMRNYFNRHSGTPIRRKAIEKEKLKSKGLYNAKILSHEYLW